MDFEDEILQMAASNRAQGDTERIRAEELLAECAKRVDELNRTVQRAAQLLKERGAPFSQDPWIGTNAPEGWPQGWELGQLGSTFFRVVLTHDGRLVTVKDDWDWQRRVTGDLLEKIKDRLSPHWGIAHLEEQAKELTINLRQPVMAQLKASVAEHVSKL